MIGICQPVRAQCLFLVLCVYVFLYICLGFIHPSPTPLSAKQSFFSALEIITFINRKRKKHFITMSHVKPYRKCNLNKVNYTYSYTHI